MPFVTINILNGKSKDYIQKVTDTINDAVIETMNFPEDDRYQVVHELPSHCLQYQGRDEDRIMMHLVMRAGRPDKAKQAFYKKCVADLHKAVGVKPSNIFITFTENRDIDFSCSLKPTVPSRLGFGLASESFLVFFNCVY